jgi:hypothetical protein
MPSRSAAIAVSIAITICLSAIAQGQTTSTLTAQTNNNTSACSAVGTPSGCFLVPDLTTATANTNAQTQILTPTPGHVSPDSILKDYLYSGATTRIISAYQPWFSPETGAYPCYVYPSGGYTGTASHPCSGYNENLAATVKLQHTTMISRGFTDVSPDWYGNGSSASSTFINATVMAEAADLAARTNYPLKLMIMIDKGLITAGMASSAYNSAAPGCPTTGTTTACITTVLEAAYDYIDGNWGNEPYYSNDPVSGNHMSLTFIDECAWPSTTTSCDNPGAVDWATVWSNVKAYMSKYAEPYKIVEEWGNFGEVDGAYIWPQAFPYVNTASWTQFCWEWADSGASTCASSYPYVADYYAAAQTAYKGNSGTIQMGGMYVGFDGSNNNYNHDLMARQCGQLFGLLGSAAGTAGYSKTNQLPWLLVATWNDLGEGTNIENGVDNCWRIATPTMSGSVVTWTQTKTDATYASPNTINYFRIWYGSGNGDLTLSQNDILPSKYCNATVTSCSFNLSDATYPPPAGSTWYIYIQQISKALLFTQMNGAGNGNGAPGTYTP